MSPKFFRVLLVSLMSGLALLFTSFIKEVQFTRAWSNTFRENVSSQQAVQTKVNKGRILDGTFSAANLDRTGKPSFVIHVGPSKTATSTLQDGLKSIPKVLAKDNYQYLGQYHGSTFPVNYSQIQAAFLKSKCLGPLKKVYDKNKFSGNQTSYIETPCWNRVYQEIEQRRGRNESIILSSEHVSSHGYHLSKPQYLAAFAAALHQILGDHWNVYVVVGYRRYFDWVLSAHKQLNGLGCTSARRAGWKVKKCAHTWNTIKQWMKRNPPSAKNYLYTDTIITRWTNVGFDVKIFNYHETNGRVTEKFVCDILTDAPHTCAYLKTQHESEVVNARDAATAAYTDIALAARKRNLLNTTTIKSRREVVQEMLDYFQEKLNLPFRHLPLDCPHRVGLEKLLNISLEYEKKVLPDWYARPGVEATHRESFWRAANETKEFCSVHVPTVLANKTSWNEVLEYLATREFS